MSVALKGRPGPGTIAVEPFRDRAVKLVSTGEASWQGLARRAGWLKQMRRKDRPNPSTVGDDSRFKRAVGVYPRITTHAGRSYRSYNATVTEETALLLCEVLEMDPVDAGL